MTPVADKEGVAAPALEDQRSCCSEVLLHDFPGRYAKRDESFLVALADHPDKAGGKITGGKGDGDQFRDPESGGVEKVQHGIVSLDQRGDGRGRGQEPGHVTQ